MKCSIAVLTAAFLVLSGCASPTKQAAVSSTSGTSSPAGGNSPSGGTEQPSNLGPVSVTAQDDLNAAIAKLPAELNGNALQYYGLNVAETKMKTDNQTDTGTHTVKFEKVQDGEAVFDITYGGSLEKLGSEKVAVRKDGVYDLEQSGSPIDPPTLDVPNDLTPGKSWPAKFKVSVGGQPATLDTVVKVIGPTKVTVDGKEMDAIAMSQGGKLTQNGKTSKVESKTWLVKGKGAVKMSLTGPGNDGTPQTVTIEMVEGKDAK